MTNKLPKIIIPVHLGGLSCDMLEIKNLHNQIQNYKDKLLFEINELEEKVNNLDVIKNIKLEPLYEFETGEMKSDDKLFKISHDIHHLLRNDEGIIGESALHEIMLIFTIKQLENLTKKFNLSDLIKLAENNIKNLDDLGDLSSIELVEMFDTKKLKKKDADEIIMKARENWFKEDKKKKLKTIKK